MRQLLLLVFLFSDHHCTRRLDLPHQSHFLLLCLLPGGFELGEATLGSAFGLLFGRLDGVINTTKMLCPLLLRLLEFILCLFHEFFADFHSHAQHLFLFDLSASELRSHFPVFPLLYFEQLQIHLGVAGVQNTSVLNTYFQDDDHRLPYEVHQRRRRLLGLLFDLLFFRHHGLLNLRQFIFVL